MKIRSANDCIKTVLEWAKVQPNILGLLLVGSHAHGKARSDSDIDLMIFTSNPLSWLENYQWVNNFGIVKSIKKEDWGAVKTLRVFYEDNQEIEFNFASLSWANLNPNDPGTFKVISDGARILYDPTLKLKHLLDAFPINNH